jgi:uncharacterized membrane protein YfcA
VLGAEEVRAPGVLEAQCRVAIDAHSAHGIDRAAVEREAEQRDEDDRGHDVERELVVDLDRPKDVVGGRPRVLRLGAASLLGGTTGAVLLLVLPASAFKAIVPAFIAIALVMVVLQPRLNRMLTVRKVNRENEGGLATPLAVYAAGVYGGYFGAAQGILLLGILGVALPQDLQRTNALKNVLAAIVNGVAGLYFVFAAHVEWAPAGIIAGASIVGGQIGAHYGRRLHPAVLRGVIVVVGVTAIVRLLAT